MKTVILFGAILVSAATAIAQNSTNLKGKNTATGVSPKPDLKSSHLAVFEQARLLGDGPTVITSLNYLIASDPMKYGGYADTLAQVYLNMGYYLQCNNLASILLQSAPNKESLLAMRATSLRELNQTSEAADLYNRLFQQTRNFRYGLELAQLQLTLQRLPELHASADALLAMTIKSEEKVAVPTPDNKATEQIPVKNFVHYLKALAFNAAKDKEKAVAQVEAALQGTEVFSLAKAALDTLKQPEASAPDKK